AGQIHHRSVHAVRRCRSPDEWMLRAVAELQEARDDASLIDSESSAARRVERVEILHAGAGTPEECVTVLRRADDLAGDIDTQSGEQWTELPDRTQIFGRPCRRIRRRGRPEEPAQR